MYFGCVCFGGEGENLFLFVLCLTSALERAGAVQLAV